MLRLKMKIIAFHIFLVFITIIAKNGIFVAGQVTGDVVHIPLNGATNTSTTTTTTTTPTTTTTEPYIKKDVTCEKVLQIDSSLYCGHCLKMKPKDKTKPFGNIHYFLMGLLATLIIVFFILICFKFAFKQEVPATTLRNISSETFSSKSKTTFTFSSTPEPTILATSLNDETFDVKDPKIKKKHAKYMISRQKRDEEDGKSSKFKKKGHIFIPKDVDNVDFKKIKPSTKKVVLKKVYYDQRENVEYEIGTDVDDIEFATDTIPTRTNTSASMMTTTVNLDKKRKKFNKKTLSLDKTHELSTQ